MMNDIKEKTYSEILSDIRTLELIKKVNTLLSLFLLCGLYIIIKFHGLNLINILLLILNCFYFMTPLIIEMIFRYIIRKEKYKLK